jgi:hypothetical protein
VETAELFSYEFHLSIKFASTYIYACEDVITNADRTQAIYISVN